MLTRKFLTIYGFVGVAIMGVLLAVIWFKLLPPSFDIPIFIFAFVIWVSRFVLRFFLVRKERREASDMQPPTDSMTSM